MLPESIGGAVEPENPFKLKNVCKKCNQAAGRHIDAPFVRNWFIHQARFTNSARYADANTSPVLPCGFMGALETEWVPEGEVCDVWVGPAGDPIYHLHKPYPDDSPNIGRPFPGNDIDDGYAFIFLAGRNTPWRRLALNSAKKQFSGADLYLVNGVCPEPPCSPIPNHRQRLRHELVDFLGREDNVHWVRGQIRIDADHRFLAKLALGLGARCLESSFVTSASATRLRNFMWERNLDTRQRQKACCVSAFSEGLDNIKPFIAWPPGHTLVLYPVILSSAEQHLLLLATFYGDYAGMFEISDCPAHWPQNVRAGGAAYVVAPGFRRFAGPMSFHDLIGGLRVPAEAQGPLRQLVDGVAAASNTVRPQDEDNSVRGPVNGPNSGLSRSR